MLNETNLIDIGSAKPKWTSTWLPLFNGLLKSLSVERFFISFGTISQIFGSKWEQAENSCVLVSGVIRSHVI